MQLAMGGDGYVKLRDWSCTVCPRGEKPCSAPYPHPPPGGERRPCEKILADDVRKGEFRPLRRGPSVSPLDCMENTNEVTAVQLTNFMPATYSLLELEEVDSEHEGCRARRRPSYQSWVELWYELRAVGNTRRASGSTRRVLGMKVVIAHKLLLW
ncbi:hypothetical protein TRAPUB_10048 [Trametes pubescens]|uniref:Uncharacterized protein n=1 Tax=Trametes pubescens TaxID=154538 RepID=A0A1M2W0V0_TRAPU|nr:hypothetical protein TRAPUB_10048 [Trametes pubescens]